MKRYGVKEVATMSGISIRTLHYYDKIGLLPPAERTEAGYRLYGQTELLRLQQILFFRELDVELKEIGQILADPDFDLMTALKQHKEDLQSRQDRIATLLQTIDNTMYQLTENMMKNPEELYEGLPREVGTTYRQEAVEEYGQQMVDTAEASLMKRGKEGFKQLQVDFEQLNKQLFDARGEAPDSESVQDMIASHYKMIRAFWGTAGSDDKQAEAYAGLGQLYVDDERFTLVDGEAQPDFARFLKLAMAYFAETKLI